MGNNLTLIVNQTGYYALSGINWFSVMFKFVRCLFKNGFIMTEIRDFFSFL